jgi:hypothetical protein
MTALVLGCLSVAGPMSVVLFPLALTGPFAWVIAVRAKRQMAAQPERWSGRDEIKIGYILGIIGSVICLLVVAGIATAIAVDVATNG